MAAKVQQKVTQLLALALVAARLITNGLTCSERTILRSMLETLCSGLVAALEGAFKQMSTWSNESG